VFVTAEQGGSQDTPDTGGCYEWCGEAACSTITWTISVRLQ